MAECKNCVKCGVQTDNATHRHGIPCCKTCYDALCHRCEGEGTISTGMSEWSYTTCPQCDGTGKKVTT
jgi:hypothetical protein